MKSYAAFNFLCLFIAGVFSCGTVWLWRTDVMSALRPASHIPGDMVVIRDQFQTSSTIVSALPSAPVMNTSTPLITTTTAVSVLPKEINLPVPFTSQAPEKNWDQPWQDACEEAAILMMDGYYKGYNVSPLFAKDEIIKMVAWEEEKGWGRSIEIEKIATLFESYLRYKETGRKVRIIENPTVGQIKKYLANKTPVYVVADGKTLPNPHFRNGGPAYHALVIRGYTETEFITNDPGTQFGKNFSYAYDDLMNSIRDWNGGAVKTGRRVILVIE